MTSFHIKTPTIIFVITYKTQESKKKYIYIYGKPIYIDDYVFSVHYFFTAIYRVIH